MEKIAPGTRPDWVSDEMYPFESRFFATPSGQRMHFVDEGEGEPIVFVHGNPAWSFEFRHLIERLRSDYRCIAPDHIGFGLSSRSGRREDHHPRSHADRFAALLDALDLQDMTLFMTDWGGPIGLEFARRNPDRVKRLVISNTWCWPVDDDFHFKSFSFLMSSWLGQYFIRRHNLFVNQVMPEGGRQQEHPDTGRHGALPPCTAVTRSTCGKRRVSRIHRRRERLAALDLGRTRGLRGQACAHPVGTPGHRVPEEGARDLAFRPVQRGAARVRGRRTLSGGRSAGEGRDGASDLHEAVIAGPA